MRDSLVYAIGADGTPLIKIGTTSNITRRLRSIQHMSPLPLSLLWSTAGDGRLERALHDHFRPLWSHGEWFRFDACADAVASIKGAAAQLSSQAAKLPSSVPRQRKDMVDSALANGFVTFESGAQLLNSLGITEGMTADRIRYQARRDDWPFGVNRPYAYGSAANAATMEIDPFLEYFRAHPYSPRGRGPDRKKRKPRALLPCQPLLDVGPGSA